MSHEAQLRRLAALEGDIAVAVKHYAGREIEGIRFAAGAEEADLSSNVDLLVRSQGKGEREFSVVSLSALSRFITGQSPAAHALVDDFYTVGGPLIVVREMSPDVIARGVLKYLRMERALGI